MSELEKCVCGGDGFNFRYITGEKLHTVICDNSDCVCETPCYTTEDDAATAWQIMQRALKAVWTSGTPTEDGEWWFLGKVHVDGRDVWEFNSPVHVSIEKDLFTSCGQYCGHHLSQYKGIWCPANYPDPPKDSE